MIENQKTIETWARETFGNAGSNARCAARANEEMAELLRCLTISDQHPKAVEEIADVVIILFRLAERLGGDLLCAVDAKMAINRAREWHVDGTGHGRHVRDKSNGVPVLGDPADETGPTRAIELCLDCERAPCACEDVGDLEERLERALVGGEG